MYKSCVFVRVSTCTCSLFHMS